MKSNHVAALLFAAHFATAMHASEDAKAPTLAACAETLSARRGAVNSVVARLHMTLRDSAKNKDYALNGAYLGDAAGNLRLRVTSEGGQLVLDMGVRGEAVEICIPGKALFLSGARDELLDHPRSHLSLLAHCGRAHDLFFPAAPKNDPACGSCCINERAYFNIAETPSLLPRYVTRLTVDVPSASVAQKDLYARGGADAGRVLYSKYRMSEAGTEPVMPAYPSRVSLRVPGGAYVLEMDVDDLTLNTSIAPGKFTVPAPDGFKRETLAEALERNVSIWEQ